MGILSRFRDVMASNINAFLEKTEDPGKTIDSYMRGLYSDLGKVKAEAASVLAGERRARRALDECQEEIAKLQRYAVKAVEDGNEPQARRFLEMKAAQEQKQAGLQAAYSQAQGDAAQMTQMREKLAADIRKLEERRVRLKETLAATAAQQQSNARGAAPGAGDGAFRAAEERAQHAYNEAMALAELRAEAQPKDDLDELFAQFMKEQAQEQGQDQAVGPEDELAAIKAKLSSRES